MVHSGQEIGDCIPCVNTCREPRRRAKDELKAQKLFPASDVEEDLDITVESDKNEHIASGVSRLEGPRSWACQADGHIRVGRSPMYLRIN